MVNPLKRVAGFAEAAWRKLPWWVRGLLSMQRWYYGIVGVPALVATAVTLITGGALAFFGALPVATKVMWGLAATVAAFGGAGQVGAWIKGQSGQIRLMSDRAFAQYVNDLSVEIARFIVLAKEIEKRAREESLYRQLTLKKPPDSGQGWVKGIKPPSRSVYQMEGEGLAVLTESTRRGFLTQEEYRRASAESNSREKLVKWLGVVATRIPQATGLVHR